jgi:copper chaperone CopZ
MSTVEMKVKGMVCDGCVASVTRALKATDGVSGVSVSLSEGAVAIDFDPATVTLPELTAAIEAAGFDVAA